MNKKQRGAFILKDNVLYCANDGNVFDRNGVYAICATALSSKSSKIIDNIKCADKDFILAKREDELKRYKNHPNEATKDANSEVQSGRDYLGRWVYEILQNMDDAMGHTVARYIGTKGKGFRSVLEITDAPAIFSGAFKFFFSKNETKKILLEKSTGISEGDAIPSFVVPHPAQENDVVNDLKKQGYATIFCFPLLENKHSAVVAELKKLSGDFLLFAQNITELHFRIEDENEIYDKIFRVHHETFNGVQESVSQIEKIALETQVNSQKDRKCFIRWKRAWQSEDKIASCMLCLPYENGKCHAYTDAEKKVIFNFYPTEQAIDLRALLHMTFNLSSDRKRIILNESTDKEKNEKIIQEFASLIGDDIVGNTACSPEVILDVFSHAMRKEKPDDENVEQRLGYAIWDTLKSKAFIPVFGGGFVTPPEVMCWEHDLIEALRTTEAVKEKCLAHKTIKSHIGLLNIIYDAKRITNIDALELLRDNAKVESLEQCITVLMTAIDIYSTHRKTENHVIAEDIDKAKNAFRALPCYWTEDNKIISLAYNYLAIEDFPDLPACLTVHKLHPRLYSILQDKMQKECPIEEYLLSSDDDILKTLIPHKIREQKDWQKHGRQLLKYAFTLFIKNQNIFESGLSKWHVPTIPIGETVSASWQLAENTFFSESWKVAKSLEAWVKEDKPTDRYLLAPLKDICEHFGIEKQKTSEEHLFRFFIKLGVMNHPKIILMGKDRDYEHRSHTGEFYNHKYYANFDKKIIQEEHFYWLVKDFALEGFPASFDKVSPLSKHKEMAIDLVRILSKSDYTAKYKTRQGYTPRPLHTYDNFALYQLSVHRWIRNKESFLNADGCFAPQECYLGSDKIFPHIRRDSSLNDIANYLNIQKEKNWDSKIWETWLKNLADNYEKFLKERKIRAKKMKQEKK